MICKVSIFALSAMLLISCAKEESSESSHPAEPLLYLPDDLEATVWAESPQFYNPTNMDVDHRGRVWITEAVNYRDFNNDEGHKGHPQGDRVMILEDTDGDGVADSSKVFVQDEDLRSPLGIAVIGNQVVVSCSPSVIVYTDEDGDDRPDKKEVLLTGFGGYDHDHGLHAVVTGPDGRWYLNTGNAGAHTVTDRSGWTLRAGSIYTGGTPYHTENTPAMRSDDGQVYTGGLGLRVNPDGTGLEVLAHNFRNSYELAVDSYGNLWQNDNDDEKAACRTSWMIEGGNAGYFNATGTRTWQADRRPGQSIQTAHWHQEDPGVMPVGDIYGSGSPTGIVVNESDALGERYRGLLLSADAGRNIIFGYHPTLDGAGYQMTNRLNFIASVPEDNENYRWNELDNDRNKWFRPSDVTIGTDGAIYVADWHDPIVGGHQMHDKQGYGRIYRIAPKGKQLSVPQIDLTSTEGQIQALLNPAVNVRNQGFKRLKARGELMLPEVKELLARENPYHRARAVWLLAQLGPEGVQTVAARLEDDDPHIRMTALRALRQAKPEQALDYAAPLAQDPSPAVRRAVAVALRDVPLEESSDALLTLVDGYDGQDPTYRYALGIALRGKEEAFYPRLLKHFDDPAPAAWSPPLATLVEELHPAAAVAALHQRTESEQLSVEARKKSLVTLAFIPTQAAATAVRQLAERGPNSMTSLAQYWLQFRKTNDWRAFLTDWESPGNFLPEPHPELLTQRQQVTDTTLPLDQRLASATEMAEQRVGRLQLAYLAATEGLGDRLTQRLSERMTREEDRYLKPLMAHFFASDTVVSYPTEAVASLTGDAVRGNTLFNGNCLMCHQMGEGGGEVGPVLTNIGGKYGKLGLLEGILHPDEGIAFGYEPYLVTMKDGGAVYGLLLSDGAVVTLLDTNGRRYMMEEAQIENKQKLSISPMPAPAYLQLSEQDVADIAAFLLQNNSAVASR